MSKIETNVIKPELNFIENEMEYLILDIESEARLDSRINDVESYIRENDGKGKSEEEKDELYKKAQDIWREYATALKETKYNFYLNRPQYNFLTDLLLKQIEYDVNTVFFAIELTELLGVMKSVKFKDDLELISIPVDPTEITYIYHLISNHKVKGLTKNAYIFAQILRRIGGISKVFNYYDTAGKNLNDDIQNWATAFEDGVFLEKRGEDVETVQGTVVDAE
jgi:hypothetical protein